MVAFGSPIRDGNGHRPRNVPIDVAVNASGKLRTGSHLEFNVGTPLCSLWLSMLDKAGAPISKLAEASTGLRGV
jgi:hypothetical protein